LFTVIDGWRERVRGLRFRSMRLACRGWAASQLGSTKFAGEAERR